MKTNTNERDHLMSQPDPDALQAWMLDLTRETAASTESLVFVMRRVLTAAYQQGFTDGQRAAEQDQAVVRQIERRATKRQEQE